MPNAWRTPKKVCVEGYSMQTSAKEIKKFILNQVLFIFFDTVFC